LSVSSTTTKNSYSGNGSTTAFAYAFKIFADADLEVIIRASAGTETTKTLTTHYTVSGAGSDSGGTVTFTTGNTPASGETVVIRRKLTLTQGTDYVENDPFPANSHEDGLDRLTFIAQGIQEELDRSFKVSKTNSITTPEFTDDASTRASKLLGFSSDGNNLEATTGRVSSVSVSAVSAGGTPTVSFNDTTGALALGVVTGNTGATGSTGSTGAAGSDGTDGVGGLLYTFSTTTSDADPGAGVIRLNNGTLGSVSQIFIDDSTAASGNPDVSAFILTWDDSTQTSDRGQVTITKKSAQQNFATYKISGASTDASGYVKLAVTHVVSNGSFSNSDAVLVSFVRTGNAGSLADPMTTRGDIIVRDSSNATARLAVGSANTVLTSDGTDPSYAQVATAMIADDAVSLAKMASGTDGNLITYDTSGNPAHVATGSSGQVLTSNGAGAAPTFQAASAGSLVHITTVTASDSASIDINSTLTSTYNSYFVTFANLVPAVNNSEFVTLFSTDNGSSYTTSNYAFALKHFYVGPSGDGNSESTASSSIRLALAASSTAADGGLTGHMLIHSPTNSAVRTYINWFAFQRMGDGSNTGVTLLGGGMVGSNTDDDAFQIKNESGNITSGTVRVYGIANS
tara:strand:+ start:62 stop:1945 length:1884 start_codon:yes stop_codon:yes gene_type:complete